MIAVGVESTYMHFNGREGEDLTMDRQEMAAALLRLISFSFDLYYNKSYTGP